MCGIFAHLGPIIEAEALNCLDRLQHRGPDGSGLWMEGLVTLGHRRLAILDLTDTGRQPMCDSSARYWITFNGEIFNFVELRKELAALGHRFRSQSDTEVLLAAYVQWGEACQDRFNGMWAFALWDRVEQSLFLSRDRFGEKPLFYVKFPDGRFAAASEMKALMPLLPHATANTQMIRAMSPRASLYYEATESCLVNEIHRLPPGHCALVSSSRMKIERWWNTLDHLPGIPATYSEQVELFSELFLDACRIRLRSDVGTGTALSGGVDSSTVAGFVSRLTHMRQDPSGCHPQRRAFVASFPGTSLDESHHARRVAGHLQFPLQEIVIAPGEWAHRLAETAYRYEEISFASPIPFLSLYETIKRTGITVSLDGHGADELFAGYWNDWSFALLDAFADRGNRINTINDILEMYQTAFPAGTQFRSFSRGSITMLVRETIRALFKEKLSYRGMLSADDMRQRHWSGLSHLNRALYCVTHRTILPTLLRNYDRYSMAAGVEVRMPFMDHRIVTMAFALPWSAKICGGFSKRIIRDASAPLLPANIAYRRDKIGLNPPTIDWLRGPLRQTTLDIIASRSFQECDLIDARRVARDLRHVIYSPRPHFHEGEHAWLGLAKYLWHEGFLKSSGAPRARS